jgi:hypothetical protein
VKKKQIERERDEHRVERSRPKRDVSVLRDRKRRIRVSSIVFDPREYVVLREFRHAHVNPERLAEINVNVDCVVEQVSPSTVRLLLRKNLVRHKDLVNLVEAISDAVHD